MKNETLALTKKEFTELFKRIRNFKIEPLIIEEYDIKIQYCATGELTNIAYDEEHYQYEYYFFDELVTDNILIQRLYEYDPQTLDDVLMAEYKKTCNSYESRCNKLLDELLQSLTEEEKEALETMRMFDDYSSVETIYETYLDKRCWTNNVKTDLDVALELVKRSGYSVVKSSDFV